MSRRLIDEEQVTTPGFGRGDPGERGWAADRRRRAGLAIFDLRYPSRAAALPRRVAGDATQRWRS